MVDQLYTTRDLKRSFFGFKVERPQAAPGKVLVLTGGGAPIVLWPGDKPTAGEAAWNHYHTLIEIDTSKRDFNFTEPVKAKGGDVSFQVTFSASYKVSDPVRVINEGISNPVPALKRVITESIGRVTELYDIEDVQGATVAVRDVLDKGKYTEKLPFELSTINVKLDLDAQARDYLAKHRQIDRDARLAAGSHQQITAKAEADILQQRYALDLQQKQRQFELELDKQKVQMELQIQNMRLEEVYKPALQNGLWGLLVQRLAQNPNDIDQVSDLIVQLHAQQLAADVNVLEAMIKGDRIENQELKGVTTDLVRRLRSNAPNSPGLPTLPDPKQLPGEAMRKEEAQ